MFIVCDFWVSTLLFQVRYLLHILDRVMVCFSKLLLFDRYMLIQNVIKKLKKKKNAVTLIYMLSSDLNKSFWNFWGRKFVGIPWKTKRKNQETRGDDICCVWCEMKVFPKKQPVVTSKQKKNTDKGSEATKRLVGTLLW